MDDLGSAGDQRDDAQLGHLAGFGERLWHVIDYMLIAHVNCHDIFDQ